MPLSPWYMSLRKSSLSGSKCMSYFSPFVDQSSPNLVGTQGSDCSFQRRFPIDDILFPSGHICDQVAKSEISPKFWCFLGGQIFWWEGPPNFWLDFINYSHHRTCGKVWWRSAQRPPRFEDEKIKRIETSAVKYNGRRPASWRAAITKKVAATAPKPAGITPLYPVLCLLLRLSNVLLLLVTYL